VIFRFIEACDDDASACIRYARSTHREPGDNYWQFGGVINKLSRHLLLFRLIDSYSLRWN
jgi:hypothetical protein